MVQYITIALRQLSFRKLNGVILAPYNIAIQADDVWRQLLFQKERMGLGVQHIVIQADDVWRCEEQVKVLERLGKPETLHIIVSIPSQMS